MASCKVNDVNLQERLTDVLNRIQDHSIQKIDDLHQHHWKLNPSDLKLNLKSKKKQNLILLLWVFDYTRCTLPKAYVQTRYFIKENTVPDTIVIFPKVMMVGRSKLIEKHSVYILTIST